MALGGYRFEFEPDDEETSKRVFADSTKRRRNRTRRYLLSLFLIATTWIFVFFSDALFPQALSDRLANVHGQAGGHSHTLSGGYPDQHPASLEGAYEPGAAAPLTRSSAPICPETDSPLFAANAAPGETRRVFAFLPSAVEWAHLSLENECNVIDVLMPDWFTISDESFSLELSAIDAEAMREIGGFLNRRGPQVELFPIIRLASGLDRAELFTNLASVDVQDKLAASIFDAARSVSANGVCLDFGRFEPEQSAVIGSFMKRLGKALTNAGTETCTILGIADKGWDSKHLAGTADYFVMKMFEQPWLGSPAAPLAPDNWFAQSASMAVEQFGRDKLVVAVGTGAVDWPAGQSVPEAMSYSKAIARIATSGGRVSFSPDALNTYSSFIDDDGSRHQMWMLDAASVHNQLLTLDDLSVTNVALWPIGGEDPAIWQVLAGAGDLPEVFHDVKLENYVDYFGKGPFIRVASPARQGFRTVTFADASMKIVDQTYLTVPAPERIERFGLGAPNQIVLTFDDGPHPDYTPEILDTLKQTNTPAAFFVVGQNVLQEKGIVRRMVEDGHEVGSHSFWHPHMDEVSDTRAALELNLFEKLLTSTTGRGTRLFREPYQRSTGPLNISQSSPLQLAQSRGYYYVGSDITPPDWEDISAEEILAEVEAGLDQGEANVIVLHDAGNDRSETVRAVPMIISALRGQGYEFVSLADLLGQTPEEMMPVVESSKTIFYSVSFQALGTVGTTLTLVFFAAIVIGATRSVGVLILALLRRPHRRFSGTYRPPVTVVIPAYNEQDSIVSNIESVLAIRYPDLKVIVVDDGSMDETFSKVLDRFSRNPRVKVVAQLNRGKWSALNTALKYVETEVVICIDADTRIDENAVTKLVAHFQDTFVGAVAGKVVVGNRTNLLTRLQALEYITAQNIDRRAAEYMNAMLVVPGAIGAWRVSAIQAAGGYTGDTLTEDADLTIAVLRAGFRITYEEKAIAITTAPPRVRQLLAQRLRWSLGMMQTGWKHRGAILEGKALGRVALPDLMIFGYLLPLLAPVADFFFLKFLAQGTMSYVNTGSFFGSELSRFMILAYIMLPLMDIVTALTAMAFDHRENPALVLLFPIQRFFYRQLLYYSVIRAMLRAISGRLMKWTKAHRGATAPDLTGIHDAS